MSDLIPAKELHVGDVFEEIGYKNAYMVIDTNGAISIELWCDHNDASGDFTDTIPANTTILLLDAAEKKLHESESTLAQLSEGQLFAFEGHESVYIVTDVSDAEVTYNLWCSHSQHDTLTDTLPRDDTLVYILDDQDAAKHTADTGKQTSAE